MPTCPACESRIADATVCDVCGWIDGDTPEPFTDEECAMLHSSDDGEDW